MTSLLRSAGLLLLVCLALGAACRDCAEGALGGRADNPFTAFDIPCPDCRDAGMPFLLVNTATLNLVVRVTDLSLGGPPPALSLERTYNLDDNRPGPFGNNWSFNLGESLTQAADQSWTLRRASGRLDRFAPSFDPTRFFALTQTADALSTNLDGTLSLLSPRTRTVRTFDAAGRLLSVRDGLTPRFTLEYDSAGRLTTARSAGRSLQFAWAGGLVASITDSAGRTVAFTYNPDGSLAQQANADGTTVSYQYDDSGLLTGIQTAGGAFSIQYLSDPPFTSVASIGLPDGTTRQYGTYLMPRQVQVTDGAGNSALYTATATGLSESITDPAGNRAAFTYDSAGRRTSLAAATGDTTRFDYDAKGNLTAITNPSGSRWTAQYDAVGNLAGTSDPNGSTWQFGYDKSGNVVTVIDPAGGTATATLDSAGRITATTDAAGNRNAYQYDSGGLLAKWTDPLNGVWSYQYDGAARIATRSEPNGLALTGSYDANNRLVAAAAGNQNLALYSPGLVRDGLNRITQATDDAGNQVSYSYGPNGLLAQMNLPGGATVSYAYDAAGRLSNVSDSLGNFALYRYDAAGYVTSVNMSGGPVIAYQYGPAHDLRAILSTGPDGSLVAGYRYALDGAGNRVTVTAQEPSTVPVQVAPASMGYNAAGRIVGRDDGQQYVYDASGNLTAIQGPQQAAVSYDAFGRLAAFNGASAITESYDSSGRRAARGVNGAVRQFVYDLAGRVVMETDASGTPLAWYVYGLGLLWKNTAGGKTYFYHCDGSGNVVALSDPTAGVVNRYRYDPTGRLTAADEAVENAFRAHGEAGWVDDGNGLLYAAGRYVVPELRLSLHGSVDLSPPAPALLPPLAGPAACFQSGVADCAFGSPRRDQ